MVDIEFRQLRYFVTVAEELNFTRAAERLQIAQPPLSRQIQSLENALGVTLLERTKRQVQLTPAGEVFLERCRQILDQVETSILATQRVARGEVGRLVIGFEGFGYGGLILQAVQAFRFQFPDVELILQEMPSGKQVEALQYNQIELGFIEPVEAIAEIEVETLLSEPLVVALATNHPFARQECLALSQLAEEPWITGRSKNGCGLLSRILEACAQAGFTPKVAQETNDIQMTLNFVAAGLGMALLPASMGQMEQFPIAYRSLEPPSPTIRLAIAYNPNNNSPILQAFKQAVRAISTSWQK